jgi:Zn-dependent peptidase ImmA (M78 family)
MNPITAARDLLTEQDIVSFELSIESMKFNKTILFDTFSGYAKTVGIPGWSFDSIKDGCTVIKDDNYLILTRETASQRQRWTLAHELGHIHLAHDRNGENEERQANRFASELLIPELVVLELQRRLNRSLSATEIGELFCVSHSAAQSKLNQIRRKEIFSAYRKTEIMEKYESLIHNYIKKNRKKLCLTL